MEVRTKIIVALVGMLFMGAILIPGADATLSYPNIYPGGMGGMGFTVGEDHHFSCHVYGNTSFDVYVVTEENHDRWFNDGAGNGTFAYIADYSYENVTDVTVNGTLSEGSYWIMVRSLGNGTISLDAVILTPVAAAPFQWDLVLIVVAAMAIASLATFFVTRSIIGRKG